jgi:hypothetical protein
MKRCRNCILTLLDLVEGCLVLECEWRSRSLPTLPVCVCSHSSAKDATSFTYLLNWYCCKKEKTICLPSEVLVLSNDWCNVIIPICAEERWLVFTVIIKPSLDTRPPPPPTPLTALSAECPVLNTASRRTVSLNAVAYRQFYRRLYGTLHSPSRTV